MTAPKRLKFAGTKDSWRNLVKISSAPGPARSSWPKTKNISFPTSQGYISTVLLQVDIIEGGNRGWDGRGMKEGGKYNVGLTSSRICSACRVDVYIYTAPVGRDSICPDHIGICTAIHMIRLENDLRTQTYFLPFSDALAFCNIEIFIYSSFSWAVIQRGG